MSYAPIILTDNKVPQKSNIERRTLEQFFAENIVEVKFDRRITNHPKEIGWLKHTRRMLCTANWRFVSAPRLKNFMSWRKPRTNRGKQWYRDRKLLICWDICKLRFRMISLDNYSIVGYTPIQTLEQQNAFMLKYFRELRFKPFITKLSFSDK